MRMKIIDKWKEGIEPCFRILFVGLLLNIIGSPAIFLSKAELGPEYLGTILPVFYLIIVLPITMPWILKTSGFELDQKNCGGGMNEAAIAKQESLDQETKGETGRHSSTHCSQPETRKHRPV